MSSTGSNVYPDIIVFPPDQVADITDEERAVLLRFKDFLVDQKFAAHSVPDAAGTMKSQMREHLIQRMWDGRSKGASLHKQTDLEAGAMFSCSSSGAAPESARSAAAPPRPARRPTRSGPVDGQRAKASGTRLRTTKQRWTSGWGSAGRVVLRRFLESAPPAVLNNLPTHQLSIH